MENAVDAFKIGFALLVFAIIFAMAVRKSGEKGEKVKELLISLNDIVL